MKDAMMEQVQLNTYVMIAPDIVVNNVSTVSYELCEYSRSFDFVLGGSPYAFTPPHYVSGRSL